MRPLEEILSELPLPPAIAIVGPTGVGKTALSLELAQRFPIEVVNADSRQVYRDMDIGTAKPKPQQLTVCPHHLIDIVDPDEEFSLAHFVEKSRQAVHLVWARKGITAVVGGTGQYVWALLEGWQAPDVPPDRAARQRLETRAKVEGSEVLYTELIARDPEAAAFIDPRNVRRVIRALEVIEATGMPFSAQRVRYPIRWNMTIIGLTMERKALYARLDDRVDQMVQVGWPDEVRRLLQAGYAPTLPSFSSVGYREMADYVQGVISLEEAVQRIKIATHRVARKQYTWFRLSDPRIHWIDVTDRRWEDVVEEAVGLVTMAQT